MDPFVSIVYLDYLVQGLAFKYCPYADGLQMGVHSPEVCCRLQTHLANVLTSFVHLEFCWASPTTWGTPTWRSCFFFPNLPASPVSSSQETGAPSDQWVYPKNSTVSFDFSLVLMLAGWSLTGSICFISKKLSNQSTSPQLHYPTLV